MANHNNLNISSQISAVGSNVSHVVGESQGPILPSARKLDFLQTVEVLSVKYLGHGKEIADYAAATISSWEVYYKTLKSSSYNWQLAESESARVLFDKVVEIRNRNSEHSVLGRDVELASKSDLSLISLSAGLLPEAISTPLVMLLNVTGVEASRRIVNMTSAKNLTFEEYLDLEDSSPQFRTLRAVRNFAILAGLSLLGSGGSVKFALYSSGLTFGISSSGVLGERLLNIGTEQKDESGASKIYDLKSLVGDFLNGKVPEEILSAMTSSKSFGIFSALTMGKRIAGAYDSLLDSPNDLLQAITKGERVGYFASEGNNLDTTIRAIGQVCLIAGAVADILDIGTSQSKLRVFDQKELELLKDYSYSTAALDSRSKMNSSVVLPGAMTGKYELDAQGRLFLSWKSDEQRKSDEILKKEFVDNFIKVDNFGLKIADFSGYVYLPRYEPLLRELGVDMVVVEQAGSLQSRCLTPENGYYLRPDRVIWTMPVVSFEDYLNRAKEEGGFDSKDRNNLKRNLKKSETLKIKFDSLTEEKYQDFFARYQRMIEAMPRGKNNLTSDWFREKREKGKHMILSLTDPVSGKTVASSIVTLEKEGLKVILAYAAIEPDSYSFDPSTRMVVETLKLAKQQGYTQLSYGMDFNLYGYYLPLGLMGFKSFMGFRPRASEKKVIMKILSPEKMDSQAGFFTFADNGAVSFNHFGESKLRVALPFGAVSQNISISPKFPYRESASVFPILSSVLAAPNAESIAKIEQLIWTCVGLVEKVEEVKRKLHLRDTLDPLSLMLLVPMLSEYGYLDLELFYAICLNEHLLQPDMQRPPLTKTEIESLVSENTLDRLPSYLKLSCHRSDGIKFLMQFAQGKHFPNAGEHIFYTNDFTEYARSCFFAIRKSYGVDSLVEYLHCLHNVFDLHAFLENQSAHGPVKLVVPKGNLVFRDLNDTIFSGSTESLVASGVLLNALEEFLLSNPGFVQRKKPIHHTETQTGVVYSWIQQLIDDPTKALEGVTTDCHFDLAVRNRRFCLLVNLIPKLPRVKNHTANQSREESLFARLSESIASKIYAQRELYTRLASVGFNIDALDLYGKGYQDIFLEVLRASTKQQMIMLVNMLHDSVDLFLRSTRREEVASYLREIEEIFPDSREVGSPLQLYPVEPAEIYDAFLRVPSMFFFLRDNEKVVCVRNIADYFGITIPSEAAKNYLKEGEILVEALRQGRYTLPSKEDYLSIIFKSAVESGNASALVYFIMLNPELNLTLEQRGIVLGLLAESETIRWTDLLFIASQQDDPQLKGVAERILASLPELIYYPNDVRDEASGNRNLVSVCRLLSLSDTAVETLVNNLLSKYGESQFDLVLVFASNLGYDLDKIDAMLHRAYEQDTEQFLVSFKAFVRYFPRDSKIFISLEKYYFYCLERFSEKVAVDEAKYANSFVPVAISDPRVCAALHWQPEYSIRPHRSLSRYMHIKNDEKKLSRAELCSYIKWIAEIGVTPQEEIYLLHSLSLLKIDREDPASVSAVSEVIDAIRVHYRRTAFGKPESYETIVSLLGELDSQVQATIVPSLFYNAGFVAEHHWAAYG
ncbi:MAG: hypothetical protein KBC84_06415, partial [Proteobacteria bacterium]|nr:hypothetical protein [Pseudomonadota bacterium]